MSERVLNTAGPALPAVPAADPAAFRSLMAAHPAGVAVVTATDLDGSPWGMTCSSVSSVALDPPTLLVCLRRASPTLDAVLRSGTFAVNLLHDGARAAADLFASGDPDRFDRVVWRLGAGSSGPHLTDSAHSVADCRVSGTVGVGDHTVIFGEVQHIEGPHEETPRPLLYGLRQYWSLQSAVVGDDGAGRARRR
ncbi:flavin reductase family protein [Streptomyces sp. CA-250714]|uniref:flavin reductase family protein n=1 Tax=Streptomyces sp. CA-250714 TaxID=3240060 RepID=UPI003D91D3F2